MRSGHPRPLLLILILYPLHPLRPRVPSLLLTLSIRTCNALLLGELTLAGLLGECCHAGSDWWWRLGEEAPQGIDGASESGAECSADEESDCEVVGGVNTGEDEGGDWGKLKVAKLVNST